MSPVQLVPERRAALPHIEQALGMCLASDAEWLPTYAAFILRRLIGTLSPCSRRDLLRQAKIALAGVTDDTLGDLASGALEDLIVGGDVLEVPVLAEGLGTGIIHQLLGARPSFVVQDPRIRILGIAPDDARFLPEDVQARVLARGGDRYIEAGDTEEVRALLLDLGLQQIEVMRWLGADTNEPAETFLQRMATYLERMGRNEALAQMQWLWPREGRPSSYRARWHADPPPGVQMCIARAPQWYGNPRWYLVAPRDGQGQRILELPLDGEEDMRACDLAWRIQLALDATRGQSVCYYVTQSSGGWAQIRLEFPLPLTERRRILHLGGRRTSEDHGFRFMVPSADLSSAETILTSAWMVPANIREMT